MKKWMRFLVIVTVVVTLAGALLYLALREDPRYVAAAQNIEALRKEARETFGAPTWEEYREENGIELKDDRAGWRAIKDSAPQEIREFFNNDHTSPKTQAALFQDNREWFALLPELIAPLRMHPIFVDEWWSLSYEPHSISKDVVKYLALEIVGAADSGDIEAITTAVRTCVEIIEKSKEESDLLRALVTVALRSITARALGEAVVRNRDNQEVVSAVRLLASTLPQSPHPTEVLAGAYRSDQYYIDKLQSLDPGEINHWFDIELMGYSSRRSQPGISEAFQTLWDSVVHGEKKEFRRTGKHTADALEARWIETMLQAHSFIREYPKDPATTDRQIEQLELQLENYEDPSYELAYLMFVMQVNSLVRDQLHEQTVLVSIEMVKRYPRYEDVPLSLPEDLVFEDLYSPGDDVIYRKTSTGFLIYWRGKDGIDGGFKDDGKIALVDYRILRDPESDDWGIAVNYSPTMLVP